jgi:uncharacterized damage-inducible protein DinB
MEINSIAPFIEYYKRIRFRTTEVISLIPEENIEWTYAAGKFTLGDIIRHIATIERYMYAENMLGRPSTYPGCSSDLAAGYSNTVAFLNKLHLESLAIFAGMSPANLQEKCITPGGAAITKWKWLRAMVEHEIHHRGQLFIYLGILGIKTKPIYGLTSEEVFARSGRAAD